MRIGIASDFHLGFGSGRRKGDSRLQAERAVKELLRQDVDVILLAGDVFDSPVPRPETLRDAVSVLRLAQKKASDTKFTGIGRDTPEFKGTPVVAIHGNHERRVRGDVNPTQLMDIMGYLIYLHDSGVVTNDVGIYGLGSVPESYAQRVFRSLKVKPLADTSFFMFHQDLIPYIPRASLTLKDLPRGFSYYINGHIHASRQEKKFLIVGSTVVTQMKPEESEKFVWVWDGGFEKHQIKSRPLHYMDVDAAGKAPGEILSTIDKEIQDLLSKDCDEMPMIRILVRGKLAKGFKPSDLIFTNDYDAIINFSKRLDGGILSNIDVDELDVDEIAVRTLDKMLQERKLKINAAKLYTYLIRGDETGVWNLLEGDM